MVDLGGMQAFLAKQSSAAVPTVPAPRKEPTVPRILALFAMEVTAGAYLLSAVWDIHRFTMVHEYLRGERSFADIDRAYAVADRLWGAALIMVLVSAVFLPVWTYCTVKNAAVRYPTSKLGAVGGALSWYIPIGNWVAPWSRLRQACRVGGQHEGAAISLWQLSWLGGSLMMGVALRLLRDATVGDVDELKRAIIVRLIATVMFSLAAWSAFFAMHRIDRQAAGTGQ